MLKQISSQSCFISKSILCLYEARKLSFIQNTLNRIVFLTQSHLIVVNPAQSNKYKLHLKINTQNILRCKVNRQNQVCILYKNGLLEIRNLDNKGLVMHSFNNVQFGAVQHFPLIYWEDQDIYILNQNRLELINIIRKERKVYSDLLNGKEGSFLNGIVQSKLIDKERIIIMHFSNKLSFNIVPIPICDMPIKNVTKILIMSQLKCNYGDSSKKSKIPREYLVVIIQNRILQVYNLISMKQLIEIKYENEGNDMLTISTDKCRTFLLVKFITKKNKVTRNILYKVNTDYYYGGDELEKDDQNFFQFQFELDLKQHLMLFYPRQLVAENHKYISLEMCYFKHNAKRNKGQIMLSSFTINPAMTSNKLTNCKVRQPEWKQLRQWKQIITSYIQMKDSLDQFGLDDEQEDLEESMKESNILSSAMQAYGNELLKIKPYDIINNVINNKIIAISQFNEGPQKIITQSNKQEQNYEEYKNPLTDSYLYKEEKLNTREDSEDLSDTKIEEEFIKFMKKYLKDQQIDIDPQILQFDLGNSKARNKEKEIIRQEQLRKDIKEIQQNEKDIQHDIKQKQNKQPSQNNITNPNVNEGMNKLIHEIIQKGQRKPIAQENENENEGLQQFLSSFPEGKQQCTMQCQQENIQMKAVEQSEYPQHDQMTWAIQKSIKNAFQPLQARLEKLDQRLARTQSINIAQLQRLQRFTQKQANELNNIDMTISGYCQELMIQFDRNLERGLKSYWNKIQEIDQKSEKNREKTVDNFCIYIDQQIKTRELIFDQNRACIENSLTHIRKKMESCNDKNEEDWEDDEDIQNENIRKSNFEGEVEVENFSELRKKWRNIY